jgi:hypothetical protein
MLTGDDPGVASQGLEDVDAQGGGSESVSKALLYDIDKEADRRELLQASSLRLHTLAAEGLIHTRLTSSRAASGEQLEASYTSS